MVGPIRRKGGGGNRARKSRFPQPLKGKKRGHTISFQPVTGLSKHQRTLYLLFTTNVTQIPKTPTALLAVTPRQLPAFQRMTFRILTRP